MAASIRFLKNTNFSKTAKTFEIASLVEIVENVTVGENVGTSRPLIRLLWLQSVEILKRLNLCIFLKLRKRLYVWRCSDCSHVENG